VIWVVATLTAAVWLPRLRPPGSPPRALAFLAWAPFVVLAAWGLAVAAFLRHWRRRGWKFPPGIALLGLVSSAGLAASLTAASLLPAVEFTRETGRATLERPQDRDLFSIEPFRLVELLWPNILGSRFGGNTYWRDALLLPGAAPEIWAPSLYHGGFCLLLACVALSSPQRQPWRIWLSVILVVSLLGSLGRYTSPIWAARILAEMTRWAPLDQLGRQIGPLDPAEVAPIRFDRFLGDGDGSVYWWLTIILPGMGQFRFPAKLFTFSSLALAALAGLGWDSLGKRRDRRIGLFITSLLIVTVFTIGAVWIQGSAIRAAFHSVDIPSMFGPLDGDGAYRALLCGLAHGGIVLGLSLAVVELATRRREWASAIALILTAADLAVANARAIVTVPQAVLESRPEVLRLIDAEERRRPSAGPYRVHRMPAWHPPRWQTTPSADRPRDIVEWERETLQPKYGIPLGVEYTHTFGVAGLAAYDAFFEASLGPIRSRDAALALGVEVGAPVVTFFRRAFDLWNTRYFIVPSYPHGWRDGYRGYASFLFQSESIYPGPDSPGGARDALAIAHSRDSDFQVLRNRNEFPRAWVLRDARWVRPHAGLSRDARARALREMLYADDPLWHDAAMQAVDPRRVAWLEEDKKAELLPYLSGQPPWPSETVEVRYPSPQRVEVEARLESPGLVILADVHYPGWELTIDGTPAPIYRANRVMRGAAVPAGRHRLVYTYAPRSFRAGLVVSIAGLAVLVLLGVGCTRRPIDPVLEANERTKR
jgi:hypothetical protein